MLVENISMIWATMASGSLPPSVEASVAEYSELVMVRARISTRRSSLGADSCATSLLLLRLIEMVLTGMSWLSTTVACSHCSWPSSSVWAWTRLPVFNCMTPLATRSLLMKAAASWSSTPRRLSRDASESPGRTRSS